MNGELKHPAVSPQSPLPNRPSRGGFTLVELLVVIAIISILTGLITVAAVRARNAARNMAMKAEVMQMDTALNSYKEKFGSYPPDGGGTAAAAQAAILAHLAMAFPRYNPANFGGSVNTSTGLPKSVTNTAGTAGMIDPSMALLFWLCGPTKSAGVFAGFNADPTDPFGLSTSNTATTGSIFTPDIGRIPQTGSSAYKYYPNNGLFSLATSASAPAPYLYFAASNGTYPASTAGFACTFTAAGTNGATATVYPYYDSRLGTSVPVNPTSFQILCPGLDGAYNTPTPSTPGFYPAGTNYGTNTRDDITNFASGATLGDDIPQ